MIKAFKYRLNPTKRQERLLNQTLTTCRYLYNNALAERIDKYKADKTSVKYVDQANALSKNKNEWQTQVHSQVLQDTLKRLDKTFKRFFDGLKQKRRVGYPRFKPEQRYRSFCYPQSGFRLTNDNRRISLSKIGDVKIRYSRHIQGCIKTCAVVKDVDQWFVVLTCDIETEEPKQSQNPSIGIDVGIKSFATLSDGSVIENPRTLLASQDRLAREQRRLSKKTKGSKNRAKQRIRVAKVHRKIRRQRDDFLHKVSTRLVNEYGHIVLENLNISGMLKNHCLAKHIADASWSRFAIMIGYKAESAGVRFEQVDPKHTSQDCSGCGAKVTKTLADRTHCCPNCGLVMDRDENAAVNILRKSRVGTTRSYASGHCVRPVSSSREQLVGSGGRTKNPPRLSWG